MNIKRLYIFILLVFSFPMMGQIKNELQISTQKLTSLKLSDFAERQDSILLDKKPEMYQFQWFSDQYLYLAGINMVYQYHLSGKYIRSFDCGGLVLGIAGDDVKRELYIPVSKGDQISLNCYDYSGNLLRKFSLGHSVSACVHFENEVWMIQNFIQADTVYYELSKIDCMNGDISKFGVFHKDYYWSGFSIVAGAVFSRVNEKLYFSVNTDSTLFQVRGDRFEPYLRWNITPEKRFLSERDVIEEHILVGTYLFVNYSRNNPDDPDGVSCKKYLYVKDIKRISGEYNVCYDERGLSDCVEGVMDDLYYTGTVYLSIPFNKPDCLCFSSVQANKQTKKNNYCIYLVHVKNK